MVYYCSISFSICFYSAQLGVFGIYMARYCYGWAKKPKKPNRPKNQNEIEPKNRLTELSSLVLVFVLHKIGFDLQNTKTVVSVSQPKNKIYIYI